MEGSGSLSEALGDLGMKLPNWILHLYWYWIWLTEWPPKIRLILVTLFIVIVLSYAFDALLAAFRLILP